MKLFHWFFSGLGQLEMQGEYVDESEKDAAALKVWFFVFL